MLLTLFQVCLTQTSHILDVDKREKRSISNFKKFVLILSLLPQHLPDFPCIGILRISWKYFMKLLEGWSIDCFFLPTLQHNIVSVPWTIIRLFQTTPCFEELNDLGIKNGKIRTTYVALLMRTFHELYFTISEKTPEKCQNWRTELSYMLLITLVKFIHKILIYLSSSHFTIR